MRNAKFNNVLNTENNKTSDVLRDAVKIRLLISSLGETVAQ